MAQIAATCQRLEWDNQLDNIKEDICLIIGDMPPVPRQKFKHVILVGDAAIRDSKVRGIEIPGNPPLPSVQIVQTIIKMIEENK